MAIPITNRAAGFTVSLRSASGQSKHRRLAGTRHGVASQKVRGSSVPLGQVCALPTSCDPWPGNMSACPCPIESCWWSIHAEKTNASIVAEKGRKNKEPCTLHGSEIPPIKLSVFSFFH